MKHTGDKDPAMLLYGDDFYADEAVKLMSLEQEAIYLRLLWHSWREGSIPGDLADLAALVGVSTARFRKLWPRTAVKWATAETPGRLVNPRQEHERRERSERSRRLRDAGIAGNAKRWEKRSGGDPATIARRSPGDAKAMPSCDRQAIPSTSNRSERVSEGAHARGPEGDPPSQGAPGPTAAAAPSLPEPPREPDDAPDPGARPPDPGAAALREALLDRGVLRMSPRRLSALVAAMAETGWTPADVAEAAASVGGSTAKQRAGRLAALLLDDERRVAFGDDLARRQAQERRARA